MDFSGMPGLGSFFFLLGIAFAIFATLIGTALKLAGVLLLSWRWVLSPVPLVVFGGLLGAGIVSLFDQ